MWEKGGLRVEECIEMGLSETHSWVLMRDVVVTACGIDEAFIYSLLSFLSPSEFLSIVYFNIVSRSLSLGVRFLDATSL